MDWAAGGGGVKVEGEEGRNPMGEGRGKVGERETTACWRPAKMEEEGVGVLGRGVNMESWALVVGME
jgi:hypothetical protein